jgi:hypothetical protein
MASRTTQVTCPHCQKDHALTLTYQNPSSSFGQNRTILDQVIIHSPNPAQEDSPKEKPQPSGLAMFLAMLTGKDPQEIQDMSEASYQSGCDCPSCSARRAEENGSSPEGKEALRIDELFYPGSTTEEQIRAIGTLLVQHDAVLHKLWELDLKEKLKDIHKCFVDAGDDFGKLQKRIEVLEQRFTDKEESTDHDVQDLDRRIKVVEDHIIESATPSKSATLDEPDPVSQSELHYNGPPQSPPKGPYPTEVG